ncbi:uncharacterized protein [Drosophila takahashii]|uniref:uncharacterized protein n=1 Tax=Drosophila takahashii TaxID=29030 RepID=UPI001CF7F89D|nr:uncharacterized protein LOC108065044 [Drosophila takahashii]
MAPRKRISKIASRSMVPVVQTAAESTSQRSVGTQTNILAMGASKRKKIQDKVKPLALQIPLSQQLAVRPPAAPLAASIMLCEQPAVCPPFVPDSNEKACQAVDSGTLHTADRWITPNSGERQMSYLKSLVTNRREKANHWDRRRLETLMTQINDNPPPRWHLASQMWLEVDQLEERIEAYDQRELLNDKKRKIDEEVDKNLYGGQDEEKAARQDEQQNGEVLQQPAQI